MTPRFSLSLRAKLLAVIVATTLVALAVALCAMIAYDLRLFQSKSVVELETQAELLGKTTAPAPLNGTKRVQTIGKSFS